MEPNAKPPAAPAPPAPPLILQPAGTTRYSPGLRNAIHFAVFFVVGLPLILIYKLNIFERSTYSYWVAAVHGCGLFHNLFILPHTPWGKVIKRADDKAIHGILLYPLALAVTFLIFPLYAAFAAWAVLSCGDAPASWMGRLVPKYRLNWNEKKSYFGTLAFFAVGFGGAFLSLWLMPCPFFTHADGSPESSYVWTLALLCAAAGAFVESLSSTVDDNLTVPAAVAGIAVGAAYFLNLSTHGEPHGSHVQPEKLIEALVANALLGTAVLLAGFASVPAVALGMALGTLVYFFAGWQGYAMFTLFVAAGSGLSKLGWARKSERKVAEAHEGRRGVANVAANLLVPAACCALYPLSGFRPALLLAFAGALAAAFADTASSEVGVLAPWKPRLITNFKQVPHGTNGAISLLGTAAAVLAATLMALTAVVSGFVKLAAGITHDLTTFQILLSIMIIVLSGFIGTVIDSILGATLEDKFPGCNKSTVNFACTLAGALTAGGIFEFWRTVGAFG